MDKFLKLAITERKDIFDELAIRQGISPIILEKDFWICWTLRAIYSIPELSSTITFKGGTSISKAYGLIQRLSEDIDLTLDKHKLNSTFHSPLEEGISNKEKSRRIEGLKLAAQQHVCNVALPLIKNKIIETLDRNDEWSIEIDKLDTDQQTLLFAYPKILQRDEGYIKPIIRLEFGARGDTSPSTLKTITPYIAEALPSLFNKKEIDVPTLSIERTFWEKVTILHAISHGTKLKDRQSRHYYDTYMISQDKDVVANALENNAYLLQEVTRNKSTYFPDKKASYDTAKIGSLKLVPTNSFILNELEEDYRAMDEMFMTSYPDFTTILNGLNELEKKLNILK